MSNAKQHELTITVRNAGHGGVEASTPGGAVRYGTLDFDDLRRETIDVLDDLLRRDAITRREELQVLGRHLYRAIFTGDILVSFNDKLKEARADKQRLRLQLTFTLEMAELIRLPWEFLFDEKVDFLATCVDLVLSRFMPTDKDRGPLAPTESPLRILVVVSRVKGLDTVMAKDVIDALEKMQQTSVEEWQAPIELHVLKQPTRQSLIQALRQNKPHIFHFIGHGVYERSAGKGQLALSVDDSGTADWCDDIDLVKIFAHTEAYPRLVLLHMCEGGAAMGEHWMLVPYTGFGPKLIRAEIPAVVAMQYPISNDDATWFALAFYEELAKGGSVDAAVQRGRESMALNGKHARWVFGTPVLYMHSSDGIILPRRAAGASAMPARDRLDVAASRAPEPVQQPSAKPEQRDRLDVPASRAPEPAREPSAKAEPPSDGSLSPTALVDRAVMEGMNALRGLQPSREQFFASLKAVEELGRVLATKNVDEMRTLLMQAWNAERDEPMRTILRAMINTVLI